MLRNTEESQDYIRHPIYATLFPAKETWRPVVGHESSYAVSSTGRVKSLERDIKGSRNLIYHKKERVLCLCSNPGGYSIVVLYGKITRKVHHLVLESFVGPRPEGMICRHLDGDPSNNKVENLAWGTYKENTADMNTHGTMKKRAERISEARRRTCSAMTQEERNEMGRRVRSNLTTEKMREAGLRAQAQLTTQQRRERSIKGWANRRKKQAEETTRKEPQSPNPAQKVRDAGLEKP